jgi:hypothetical protein
MPRQDSEGDRGRISCARNANDEIKRLMEAYAIEQETKLQQELFKQRCQTTSRCTPPTQSKRRFDFAQPVI